MAQWPLGTLTRFIGFRVVAGMPMFGEEFISKKVEIQEARRLVYQVAKDHSWGAEVSKVMDQYDTDFFYFEIIVANPVASLEIGHYAVNPWTGDEWSPAGCEIVTLPSLQKMRENPGVRSGSERGST